MDRLLEHFSARTELPDDFALVLESLLRNRNVFVHNLFMQPWFDLNSQDGCAQLDQFVRSLRASAKIAMKVMMTSLPPKDTDAARSEAAQRYIDNVLLRINETVHPDVEAFGVGDYVDQVAADARANFSVKRR